MGVLLLVCLVTGKFPGSEGDKIQEKATILLSTLKEANSQHRGFFEHIENVVKGISEAAVELPFGIFFVAMMAWNDAHGYRGDW